MRVTQTGVPHNGARKALLCRDQGEGEVISGLRGVTVYQPEQKDFTLSWSDIPAGTYWSPTRPRTLWLKPDSPQLTPAERCRQVGSRCPGLTTWPIPCVGGRDVLGLRIPPSPAICYPCCQTGSLGLVALPASTQFNMFRMSWVEPQQGPNRANFLVQLLCRPAEGKQRRLAGCFSPGQEAHPQSLCDH